MQRIFAVAIGKLLRYSLRLIRRGGGSAFPGLIASKIDPGLIRHSLSKLPMGVVVISGSAGKSSTTHYLVKLLEAHGIKVFTNPSTANIKQGLFSAVLKESSMTGNLDYDMAVLELDEGHGPAVSDQVPLRLVVLTNVLSDQLDRFVDPELVSQKLSMVALQAASLVVNADDPNLCQIAQNHARVSGFGIGGELPSDTSLPKYALNFGDHPAIPSSVQVKVGTVLQLTADGKTFDTPATSIELALNLAAAYCAATDLIELKESVVAEVLASNEGVFARNELVEIQNQIVNLRLVQNPTSFQLNLSELTGVEVPLMLMAGRDIHDPSWLWTVDFSALRKVQIVAGFNAAELALRLKVAGVEVEEVISDVSAATDRFLALPGQRPTILFSADAMRRFRRYTKVAK